MDSMHLTCPHCGFTMDVSLRGKPSAMVVCVCSRCKAPLMCYAMGEDVTVAAVLETYAEDATEYNDQGQIVWAESNDANIAKFVSFLLDSMNVDKNIYKWVYSLCKYGDIYWRLYRESDYDDDILASELKDKPKSLDRTLIEDLDERDKKNAADKAQLKEDVNIKYYSKNDKYVHD